MTSGGAGEGFGHVSRCAEVARAARALGARVAVSLAGDAAARSLLAACLGSRAEVRVEAWRPGEAIPGDAPALLVDTRQPVRRALEGALRRGARTVVLDRLDFLEEATATVLPVAHGPRIRHPRLRQGPEWCILPAEVRDAASAAPAARRDAFLLTLGGADPLEQTGRLAALLAAELPRRAPVLGALERHALLPSRLARDAAARAALEGAGFRTHALLPRSGFVSLALRSAVAVCGFGVATYELARLGVPALHRVHRAADAPAAETRRGRMGGRGVSTRCSATSLSGAGRSSTGRRVARAGPSRAGACGRRGRTALARSDR